MSEAGRWPRLLAATGLALTALVGCSGGGDDGVAAETTATAAPATTTTVAPPAVEPVGTFPVARRVVELLDESRDTTGYGGTPDRDGRRLPTLAWYPAASADDGAPVRDGTYPVVLFAHGWSGDPEMQDAVLTEVASAGYVVLAPTFPSSNIDAPGGPDSSDLPNQPADLSFVLDRFLVDPDLADHIDGGRVGVIGHSLGGATALGFAYGACCRDDRVDVVVAWAGANALGPEEGETFPDVPLLLIHGDDDTTLPDQTSRDAFDQIDAPRWWVTLHGANHLSPFFGSEAGPSGALTVTITVAALDAALKDAPDAVEALTSAITEAGPEAATIRHRNAT